MYLHRLEPGSTQTEPSWVGDTRSSANPSSPAPVRAFAVKDGIDGTSVEGAADMPYASRTCTSSFTRADAGAPVLWWRSVGHTHTAYLDRELSSTTSPQAAGRDPLAFRLALLADKPRHLGVLKLAAEKAGWGDPDA